MLNKRDVKILSTYATDYDDIRCNAILMEDGREIANIIASYDESDIRYSIGDKDTELTDDFVKKAFRNLISDGFDSYLKLPKISNCSKLLQSVYDDVCSSDSCMCHIDENDWEDFYSDDYNEEDIKTLESEIQKYNLEEVIGVNDGEYKIIGYGDLETRFNDDRNLQKYVIKNMNVENTGGYVMVYFGELESGEWYSHSDLNDNINIYDNKPFEDDYYEDNYEWECNHLIDIVSNESAKEMFRKMNSLVDKIAIEPNWNKQFHNHFNKLIEKENDNNFELEG